MPVIRKTADLLNNFSEILEFCQNYRNRAKITSPNKR